ncbi:MAG: hypothetical protein A4E64_01755 [Syntrophorhabdus sp. PtaU1.Bin058]|nr:MAG: hypothetical protein A4E64_01755 [Syntrophorhabdus sp. PtaU1.Bin058]
MITAKITDGKIIIEADLEEPKPSSSGKTMVIASSRGNKKFDDVLYKGKPVTIGLNVYYHK